MKQSIPFKKDIIFKSKIAEITSISLEHTLSLDGDVVTGDFIISGDYKMTEASINKEEFYYKLPFDIALDSRFDLSNLQLDIDDFYYEIINNDILRVNIEVSIDGLKEKEYELIEENELIELETEIDEIKEELNRNNNKQNIDIEDNDKIDYKIEDNDNINIEIGDKDINVSPNFEVLNNDYKEKEPIVMPNNNVSNIDSNQIKSLFNNFVDDETFETYRVYIMREDDTIDNILSKYGITKELLKDYNDVDNIKIGDKIIIPSLINEK